MSEPKITINGTPLSEAEAMTLRVALGAWMLDLTAGDLGDDETGRAIAAGYLRHSLHIERLMLSRSETPDPVEQPP